MNAVITMENFNDLLSRKRDELWLQHSQEQDYEKRLRIMSAITLISDLRVESLSFMEIAKMVA